MSAIKIFEDRKVRSHFDSDTEIWYFSIVDIVEILTGSTIPKRYWSDLRKNYPKKEAKCTIKSYG